MMSDSALLTPVEQEDLSNTIRQVLLESIEETPTTVPPEYEHDEFNRLLAFVMSADAGCVASVERLEQQNRENAALEAELDSLRAQPQETDEKYESDDESEQEQARHAVDTSADICRCLIELPGLPLGVEVLQRLSLPLKGGKIVIARDSWDQPLSAFANTADLTSGVTHILELTMLSIPTA